MERDQTPSPSEPRTDLTRSEPRRDLTSDARPQTEPGDVRRKLFFGLALVLAMGSMYAGILGAGRVVQYGLAILALIVVVVAMASGVTARRQL